MSRGKIADRLIPAMKKLGDEKINVFHTRILGVEGHKNPKEGGAPSRCRTMNPRIKNFAALRGTGKGRGSAHCVHRGNRQNQGKKNKKKRKKKKKEYSRHTRYGSTRRCWEGKNDAAKGSPWAAEGRKQKKKKIKRSPEGMPAEGDDVDASLERGGRTS